MGLLYANNQPKKQHGLVHFTVFGCLGCEKGVPAHWDPLIDRLSGASAQELLVAVARPECHLSPVG